MNKKRIYVFITILFIAISIFIISNTNIKDNIHLSKCIQIILILYLFRVIYGCILYIKKQYEKQKYSYSIIMNLGLVIFISINIIRMMELLIKNWNTSNIIDIYNTTLNSFSYFAMLTLPFIIILSIYSIITNIVLIKKERFSYSNLLGVGLGLISLFGLFGNQVIYKIASKYVLNSSELLIKKFIDISLNATLSYLYCIILATLYCNIIAAKHNPKYDKDYVIILGSKIKNDGSLTPLLKSRVDRALYFGEEQKEKTKKEVIYVPSGAKGIDEVISEASAIKNYLIKKGVDSNHILIEDKSTSTIENMRFSKDMIDKINKNAKIAFSTTNYHVFRSGVIANKEGIDCEGMGSKTKWYFYTNALIREFLANLFSERIRHILLLIIINSTLFVLTFIGYYYKFFMD